MESDEVSGASVLLRRKLSTTAVEFAGTVARRSQRDQLLVVLISIVEHAGQVAAAELADHLFGRGRVAFAERILAMAAELGLVRCVDEDAWVLSEGGIEALRAGQVLVPQFGVWRVVIAEDVLLDGPMLTVDRVGDPRLWDGIQSVGSSSLAPTDAPPSFTDALGSRRCLVLGGREEVYIAEPCVIGKVDSSFDSGLDLEWAPLEGSVRIAQDGKVQREVECARVDGISALPPDAVPGGQWNEEAGCLEAPASCLTDEQLLEGAVVVDRKDVETVSFGLFEHMAARLPVRPTGTSDAEEWVRRRIEALVDDYASLGRWCTWVTEASTGLENLPAGHMPTRCEIRAQLEDTSLSSTRTKYWHLAAAEDWDV
ncbi:MAG: hypothetical protein JJU45_08160 [Acidimicrobiia bacterium]|nr:hypothetical protein [Acidimicrobiia bacterium]